MTQKTKVSGRGVYRANLLGNIRSHLSGLQGYDVMALELIQNADDAEADTIKFDITSEGLYVSNSSEFSYCGDLESEICLQQENNNYSCDFHRITDVGSGGKLARPENIGRFGIGFVSTYQIADHPEIHSAGIKLTLMPEIGEWVIEASSVHESTKLFLPWASDPSSGTRTALNISSITESHIEQLVNDIQQTLRSSLLFLRYVNRAEITRNGKRLLLCELERESANSLRIKFSPGKKLEHWYILWTDMFAEARKLYAEYPNLERLNRSTKVSIGIQKGSGKFENGLLYAFLPSEQQTALPLHINADFFPESDRKAIIFAGHQQEQVWNEMLVRGAAEELSKDLEALLSELGLERFWKILGKAGELPNSQGIPACYVSIWDNLKEKGATSHIVPTLSGQEVIPGEILIPYSQLSEYEAKVFQKIGGQLHVKELSSYRNVLTQLGAQVLTLSRFLDLLESNIDDVSSGDTQVKSELVKTYYQPLWSIVNGLLLEDAKRVKDPSPHQNRLMDLPILVTDDLHVISIRDSFLSPATIAAKRIIEALPQLAIADESIRKLEGLGRLVKDLDLDVLVAHLGDLSESDEIANTLKKEPKYLRKLYTLILDLDDDYIESDTYESLSELRLWLTSGNDLVSASEAVLPGNFSDPTGETALLDITVLPLSVREFLTNKLGVVVQTINSFVQVHMPDFYDDTGPISADYNSKILLELAKHPDLLDDADVSDIIESLPIIPTKNGAWAVPGETYWHSKELAAILGNDRNLWVDDSRLPKKASVRAFIDRVGICKTPSARHLVDRIIYIANQTQPTERNVKASASAFYFLCEKYSDWREDAEFTDAIEELKEDAYFPADGDESEWHFAEELHAPFRSEAFKSQALILAFSNRNRLSKDLLVDLDVSAEPATELVIAHLRHCIENNSAAHSSTYQILNERVKEDRDLISELQGEPFIFVEPKQSYVKTTQLFLRAQQLGRFAFTIPSKLDSFRPLFSAVGIRDYPNGKGYIEILLEIVEEHYQQSKTMTAKDEVVYNSCLQEIVGSIEEGEIVDLDLEGLRSAPVVKNLVGGLVYPDEVLLQDSEWLTGFFDGEIDAALCKPKHEVWQLLEVLGVRRLSVSAEVKLEFIDGALQVEDDVTQRLTAHVNTFVRCLHDKSNEIRQNVKLAIQSIETESYDVVRINASVLIDGDEVAAPPAVTKAFFNRDQNKLILSRPVESRSWSHILHALFHRLMPEELGSEISKLTLGLRHLLTLPPEEAQVELSDAGIPDLDVESELIADDSILSTELDDLDFGEDSIPSRHEETGMESISEEPRKSDSPLESGESRRGSQGDLAGKGSPKYANSSARKRSQGSKSRAIKQLTKESSTSSANEAKKGHLADPSKQPGKAVKNTRPKYKQQRDYQLLSYVRSKQESGNKETNSEQSKQNLATEVLARDFVCKYERARGRIPEQKAQTHPGWDIESIIPSSGEIRYIEVKGLSGNWNKSGVSLSKMQFSNAQDLGNQYWLYVVENVYDPEHANVYPIQSPSSQIHSFMFDHKWRVVVSEEPEDPTSAFAPGIRIRHKTMGDGEIISVTEKGASKLLKVQFDHKIGPTPNVPLNVYQISVLDDPNG